MFCAFQHLHQMDKGMNKKKTVQNSPKEPYSYGEVGALPVETYSDT